MRIGFDAKRLFHNHTGLGNYSRDLVRIMNNYYPDNQYFLFNPKKDKKNRFQLLATTFEILPTGFFSKLFPFWWRSFGIKKDIKNQKLDVFHGLSGELPFGIKKTGIKSIVTVHDLIFVRYPELYKWLDRNIYVKKHTQACHDADIVVAISEQTKRDLVEFLKIDESKIKVIYQGCNEVFKKEQTSDFIDQTIKKYQLPNHFLLYVGSLIKRKNALSAVKAVEKTGDHLVIVGDGRDYRQKVEAYVNEHQLNDKIHFLKDLTLEEIAVLYKKSEIFIYPSSFEGFGIPIIEALFSRTPVITGTGSCFSEAGGPYSNYIHPDDINSIALAINEIKNNSPLRKEMIENGYKYVQQFNDEIIAKNWNSLYKSLLSKK